MHTEKLTITNRKGINLSTQIDIPTNKKANQIALFSHCFTCTSQLNAVKNISKALVEKGILVVRFDFTGLGKSKGEFANSHFEANVEDLIDVNNFISQKHGSPNFIIGHSLGGAAAITAASQLKNLKAVVTIAAPSDVLHTTKHFASQINDLTKNGETNVIIGGRKFTISKEFVEGFQKHNLPEIIKHLRKPILIMHAPFDEIVSIENAHTIYKNAMHPKSFISLDTADHLLTKKEDSLYVGNIIATWVARYIETNNEN